MLDIGVLAYTVVGLVPNLLLILWVLTRLSREVRLLSSRVATAEREMQMIDEGVKQVSEELRRIHPPTHDTSSKAS